MRRREFVSLFGSAAAWPNAVIAQEPDRVRRVGYLSPATGFNPVDEAFEKSLQQLGWVKDRNIKIEYRYTGGRQDKVGPLVAEVVGLGLDLFVAWTPPVALGVKQAAPQSPLVFLAGSDVIEIGLVSNLARPGGNVTGISAFASEQIIAKRLELLKEVIPSLARMAVIFSTETRSSGLVAALTASARTFGVELDEVEVEVPQALEAAMRGAKERGAQAVFVWQGGFSYSFAKEISDAANANGLPSIHPVKEGAFAGCLLAYAADLREQARRGAAYVDKILRGIQAGSLPVEQMSKVELMINLKTAKALGLTIPPTLLARADEVIE
jgi:putative tryptophan/tyrosine transport system substrate-binding protein